MLANINVEIGTFDAIGIAFLVCVAGALVAIHFINKVMDAKRISNAEFERLKPNDPLATIEEPETMIEKEPGNGSYIAAPLSRPNTSDHRSDC